MKNAARHHDISSMTASSIAQIVAEDLASLSNPSLKLSRLRRLHELPDAPQHRTEFLMLKCLINRGTIKDAVESKYSEAWRPVCQEISKHRLVLVLMLLCANDLIGGKLHIVLESLKDTDEYAHTLGQLIPNIVANSATRFAGQMRDEDGDEAIYDRLTHEATSSLDTPIQEIQSGQKLRVVAFQELCTRLRVLGVSPRSPRYVRHLSLSIDDGHICVETMAVKYVKTRNGPCFMSNALTIVTGPGILLLLRVILVIYNITEVYRTSGQWMLKFIDDSPGVITNLTVLGVVLLRESVIEYSVWRRWLPRHIAISYGVAPRQDPFPESLPGRLRRYHRGMTFLNLAEDSRSRSNYYVLLFLFMISAFWRLGVCLDVGFNLAFACSKMLF